MRKTQINNNSLRFKYLRFTLNKEVLPVGFSNEVAFGCLISNRQPEAILT